MQEMQLRSLGWEDPLEEKMATHSSIHAREIPWTEEPGGLLFMGSQRVRHDLVTKQQQEVGGHIVLIFGEKAECGLVSVSHSSISVLHKAP